MNVDLRSKEAVRREALRRRAELTPEQRAEASIAICRAIMDDDRFLDAQSVHVYLPQGDEVDIRPLVDVAWELGKEVGVMRVLDDGGSVQYAVTPETEFTLPDGAAVPVPVNADRFDMESCELVIVPIVAGDERCNRIGDGKGYYDQFLIHFPRPTIGTAFEAQIFKDLPVEETDMQLDVICTEKRMIECGSHRRV